MSTDDEIRDKIRRDDQERRTRMIMEDQAVDRETAERLNLEQLQRQAFSSMMMATQRDLAGFAMKRLTKRLEEKGVRLNIWGCGCCGSPIVSIEIDGKKVIDEKDCFDLTMI